MTTSEKGVGHTDWQFVRSSCLVVDADGCRIALVSVTGCDEADLVRRGHLLASAPELFASAVQTVQPYIGVSNEALIEAYGEDYARTIINARAAISKATAQPLEGGGG